MGVDDLVEFVQFRAYIEFTDDIHKCKQNIRNRSKYLCGTNIHHALKQLRDNFRQFRVLTVVVKNCLLYVK